MERRTSSFLLGLLAAVSLASGCGSDKSSENVSEVTTTTADPTTTSEPATTPTTTTTVPVRTSTEAGPAPTGGKDAAAALDQFIHAKGLGQTGRAWDLILPAQRKLLDRNAYFSCQDATAFDIISVQVLDQYEERIAVAGIGEQDAAALTLKVTLSAGGEQYSDTDTYHAFKEDGAWYVTVDDENFECAKAG